MLSLVYTTTPFLNSPHSSSPSTTRRSARLKMTSSPPPENRTVLGVGSMGLDFLAALSSYSKPDDKIRATSLKVQGGGNASNALTCVARLGLSTRVISKIADDTQGRGILEELQADGVYTSFVVVRV